MILFSDIWKALILGIVEGVTEFLPVSSTGHLILAGSLLSFTGERAKVFDIFIQLGAIFAVVWIYREKLISVIRNLGSAESRRFTGNLFTAFLPAAVIGLLIHSWIKAYLFNNLTVVAALILGGVLILIIERKNKNPKISELDSMSPRLALGVGLAQVLSLFPGISRSGATIMGGLVLGLDRKTATEFSFFLAIPTMFAATLYDLLKGIKHLGIPDSPVFAIGFIISFISALFVIKTFLRFVARHDFTIFAYYRIIFGLLILLLI